MKNYQERWQFQNHTVIRLIDGIIVCSCNSPWGEKSCEYIAMVEKLSPNIKDSYALALLSNMNDSEIVDFLREKYEEMGFKLMKENAHLTISFCYLVLSTITEGHRKQYFLNWEMDRVDKAFLLGHGEQGEKLWNTFFPETLDRVEKSVTETAKLKACFWTRLTGWTGTMGGATNNSKSKKCTGWTGLSGENTNYIRKYFFTFLLFPLTHSKALLTLSKKFILYILLLANHRFSLDRVDTSFERRLKWNKDY